MKIIIFTLLTLLDCLSYAQSAPDLRMETINRIVNLLQLDATLADKAQGLALANKFDNLELNDALVAMLDDNTDGGRVIRDVGIEQPWIESIHILAKRFPEAGIKINIDYRYTQQDKTAFLRWWSENRTRIEYRGNTHILTDDNETPPKASEGSAPTTSTDLLDTENGGVSDPESPTAPRKAPEAKPILSTPSEEPTSSTLWAVVAVVVAVAIGLLALLLKRRS